MDAVSRAMGRILNRNIGFCLIFTLAACARPTGFQASNYTYSRVASDKIITPSSPLPTPGSVVRYSNKIEFTPEQTDSQWNPKDVHMKADVKVGGKALGEVEFKGVEKDSKIVLSPVDPELSKSLKAEMICTSEGDSCDDFFIDVFYKENDVIYHDQILPQPKKDPVSQSEKSPTETKKTEPKKADPVAKPTEPVKPVTQPTKPVSTQPEAKRPQPRAPAKPETKPPQKTEENSQSPSNENPELIVDGVPTQDVARESYVGASDEEVRDLFGMEETPVKDVPPTQDSTSQPAKKAKSPPPAKKPPAKQTTPPATKKEPEKKETAPVSSSDNTMSDAQFLKMKVRNQVVGSAGRGRLENGTSFLRLSGLSGLFFFITNPKSKDYFGSFDLALVVKKLSDALQVIMPGRKLAITSISKWGGGRLPPHEGHQNGTDVDIRYLTNDEAVPTNVVTGKSVNSNLLVGNQWKLLKMAFQTNLVEVVFVDPRVKRALCEEAHRENDYKNGDDDSFGAEVLKRIQTWPGHENHFHVRARCSSDNPRCKRIQMVFNKVGC